VLHNILEQGEGMTWNRDNSEGLKGQSWELFCLWFCNSTGLLCIVTNLVGKTGRSFVIWDQRHHPM